MRRIRCIIELDYEDSHIEEMGETVSSIEQGLYRNVDVCVQRGLFMYLPDPEQYSMWVENEETQ